MAVLLSIDGTLVPPTEVHPNGGRYSTVAVGDPLSMELLTFFPGTDLKEWGRHAEIMISSQIRSGPSNEEIPPLVNMLVTKYDFESGEPIQDYGGDIYGDPMLFYTKAYLGQRIGITLRGVEVDRINARVWESFGKTVNKLGSFALFQPAIPYLGTVGVAAKAVESLSQAFTRNDRLALERADFYLPPTDQKILQSGRYVFWDERSGVGAKSLRDRQRLASDGSDRPNVLVSAKKGDLFEDCRYFVLRVDARPQRDYEEFEIGAGSAALLAKLGEVKGNDSVLDVIQELGRYANDAAHLAEVRGLVRESRAAAGEDVKAAIRRKIKARVDLFSSENAEILGELLKPYLT